MLASLFSILNIIVAAYNDMTGHVFHFKETTTVDILKEAFYPVETHVVNTKDGYILTIHRIPHGKASQNASKGPVLLMHGLLCSSADWVVTGDKSLGISLAEAGYDVWMGNNRGNTYSRHNTNLDPVLDHKAFFKYSYDELGDFDLPAMIDYVLDKTNTTVIPYVGYSEGNTQFFAMMSKHPEYNKKISIMNAWAPVTNMYRINNKLINILAKCHILEKVAKEIGWYEMFPHYKIGNFFRAVCKLADWICSYVFNSIGSSWDRMPTKALKAKILQNFPAGMSLQQVGHYVQGTRSGVFRPFDYGTEKNMEIYDKPMPDPYNLSAVTVPVFLYYGGSDMYINNEELLNNVVKELKNVTDLHVPYDNFDHLDFIWSENVDWLTSATLSNLESISRE